jgi:hypothetical protein
MRRAPVAAVLLVLAMLLAGAGTLWKERVAVANWAAVRALDGQGYGPARPGIEAVGLHLIRLRALSLCGGALTVQGLSAHYDLLRLASFQLSDVEISGLEARLTRDASGARLGACRLKGGRSGGLTGGVDRLTLSNAHIVLDGAEVPIDAVLSARLSIAGGAIEGRDLEAHISAPFAGSTRSLRLAAQRLTVMPQSSGGVRLTFSGAGVVPTDPPIEAQGLSGELTWLPDHATAKLSVARLADRQTPMRMAPASLDAEANLAGAGVDFALHAAAGPSGGATLEATGTFNGDKGRGSAAITLGPIAFRRGGLQPADLVPPLRGMVDAVEGSLSAKGTMRFSAGEFAPDLHLQLKDLEFEAAGAQVSKLSGAAQFVQLWPPATPPHQAITATVTVAGLPPAKLRIEGQLAGKPALKLETASLEVAGGTITLEPFSLAPTALTFDTALDVAGVDLAEITKLLQIDGLSGSGRLSGRVPLAIDRGSVTIAQGRLAAEIPGVLRYAPKNPPTEIAAAGQSVALVLQALSDFHYDALTLELEKAAQGQGTLLLHLDGRNPAVMNGQAFRFNIRVESNFDRLAELALVNLQSVQKLLRQATQGSEK